MQPIMSGYISFLLHYTWEDKNIWSARESNPFEQAPQANAISFSPWPLGHMRGVT